MSKIILWGIGQRTKEYMRMGFFEQCDIIGFGCTEKRQEAFMGRPVFSLAEVYNMQNQLDYIVISNEFYEEIIEECISKGIDVDKIVITDNIPVNPYRKYYKRVKQLSSDLYEILEKSPYILVKSNEYDLIDREMRMKTGKYSRSIYMQDYFRFRTLELVVNDMKRKKVEGALAELGVFKGHFSSLMNEHFSDRKIYLFDTFEGFGKEELSEELQKGRCDERFVEWHKDTSVDLALNNLPFPQQAVICKGLFPASVTEEAKNEKYALVSLDVDFEESMYQGLKFFYPRLSDGGYIFMHDYNTFYLEGIKFAVERYEKEQNIRLCCVPIADRAGTLIIMKN